MAHLFISYSRRNKPLVERLLDNLHGAGHTTWYDKRNIRTGENWRLAIGRAIADSDVFLLALSPDAIASTWVTRELELAYSQHKPIFPVVLAPTPSDTFPEIVKGTDINAVYLHPDYEAGLVKLLADLRGAGAREGRIPFIVDYPRLKHFVGRDEDLRSIHSLLSTPGPVGLTGMGGIGKTQLAVEYAHRYRYFYPDGVFLLNAAGDWGDEFIRLAGRLNLTPDDPHAPDHRQQMIAAMANYLGNHREALVIFDNVREASDMQHREIALGLRAGNLPAHLLFTTRQRFVPNGLRPFVVDILSPELAGLVLTHKRPDLRDHVDVDEVCTALGYLPLALELGAAFLQKKPNATLRSYINYLKEHGADATHAQARLKSRDLEAYYEASLTPALQAQWDLLETEQSRHLLRILALFQENVHVPIGRLSVMAGLFDEPDGIRTPLTDGLGDANSASLIEVLEANTVRLHPLVYDFINRHKTDAPDDLRRDAAMNTALAYENIRVLEDQIEARGIQSVEMDFHLARKLIQVLDKDKLLETRLSSCLELIQRESHNLVGWNRGLQPSFLAQQIHYRSVLLGERQLTSKALERLNELGEPFVKLDWRAPRESTKLERTLIGHSGRVTAIDIAANQAFAASASWDNSVRVWDLATGYELYTFKGHADSINTVIFTHDRRHLISGAGDHLIKIWDLRTGKELQTLRGHEGPVTTLAVSQDDQWIVSGSKDGTVRVWDRQKGQEAFRLSGHHYVNPYTRQKEGVSRVFVSRDGQNAVSVGFQTIKVWDLNRQFLLHTLMVDNIQTVAVDADCRMAMAGSFDIELPLHFWNLETGEKLAEIHPHWPSGPRVDHVAMTGDGKYGFSASEWDNRIFIYRLDDLSETSFFEWSRDHSSWPHLTVEGGVNAIGLTSGDQSLVSLSGGILQIWDIQTHQEIKSIKGFSIKQGSIVACDPDGQYIITGEEDYQGAALRVWDLKSEPGGTESFGHKARITSIAVSPDGRHSVSASVDGTSMIWEIATGQVLRILRGHRAAVTQVRFLQDGHRIISGSEDSTLKIWDSQSGAIIKTVVGHGSTDSLSEERKAEYRNLAYLGREHEFGEITSIAVTPDERSVISASHDGTIRIWGIAKIPDERSLMSASRRRTVRVRGLARTGKNSILSGHTDHIYNVVLTPDGRRLLSCSLDGTIKVWDTAGGKEILSIEEPRTEWGGVSSNLAVSPDGRYFVSSKLNIWEIDSGRLVCTLPGERHTIGYMKLAWSPDGRKIFAADTRLEIWDFETGTLLHTLGSFSGKMSYGMTALAINKDGHWCISSWVSYPIVEVWDLDRAQMLAAINLGRYLTAIAICPDDQTVIGGDESGGIYCFQVQGL